MYFEISVFDISGADCISDYSDDVCRQEQLLQ